MVTKNILIDKDAQDFANYIRRSGGEVLKIYSLKQGYSFDIIRPSSSQDAHWGQKAMQQFLINSEGSYNENTGRS